MERVKVVSSSEEQNEKDSAPTGEGEKERELAKAALSVAELDGLLKPSSTSEMMGGTEVTQIPLQALEFIKDYIQTVDQARDSIIQEMESMVVNGLADLVRCGRLGTEQKLMSRTSLFCPHRYRRRTISGYYLISSRTFLRTSTTPSRFVSRRHSIQPR